MKKLLKTLLSIKTTADENSNLHKIIDVIDAEFNDLDVVTRKYIKNDKPSLVVTSSLTKHPKILLQGHVDVVDAEESAFIPVEKEGRMYARGASDMKGMVTAMIVALKEIYSKDPNADIGLMISTDEEIGGFDGVGHLVNDLDFGADIVFLPDGGKDDWRICLEEKGVLWTYITAKGEAGHGSRPWEGRSANRIVLDFYTELSTWFYKEFGVANAEENWIPTFNVGILQGGNTLNAITESAEIKIDFRFPAGDYLQKIKQKLKDLEEKYNVEIAVPISGSPTQVTTDNTYLRNWIDLYEDTFGKEVEFYKTHGGSDGRFFGEKNIPIVNVKSRCSDIHIKDEWVDLEDLQVFKNQIVKWVEKSL